MAYTKQGFINGNVLDASQLIAMEDGILANEEAISQVQQGLDVYSVEETVIGTWLDGKPLYEKTYVLTAPASSSLSSQLLLSAAEVEALGCDFVFVWDAIFIGKDGSILTQNASSNYWDISVFVASRSIKIIFSAYNNGDMTPYYSQPLYLTIRYTKTTDEPTIDLATGEELNAAYDEGVQSA